MLHDHDLVAAALRRARALTGASTGPAEACDTCGALRRGLEALESSLHVHIHIENNILFPRALAV